MPLIDFVFSSIKCLIIGSVAAVSILYRYIIILGCKAPVTNSILSKPVREGEKKNGLFKVHIFNSRSIIMWNLFNLNFTFSPFFLFPWTPSYSSLVKLYKICSHGWLVGWLVSAFYFLNLMLYNVSTIIKQLTFDI